MGVKHDNEGRVVHLEFDNFNLVASYVPNSGVKGLDRLKYRTQQWDPDFQGFCKGLEASSGKPVIVTGDLNVAHTPIDVFKPENKSKSAGYTKEERESFTKFLEEKQFVDTFRTLHPGQTKYSYFNLKSGAR